MNATHSTKPVIGLVGGIGAGKSTVAAEFEALGCARIDADWIGHELLGDESVRAAIRARWGAEVFLADGSVDRASVARKVFGRPDELAALNAILHPRMGERIAERIAAAQADPSARGVVLDAAVAFEAGWDRLCTHMVFVRASDAQRARRVRDSRGWDRDLWQSREKAQIPLDSKAARCYDTLENSSSISSLKEQIRRLFFRIVSDVS
ncbi:MAG TPA: dephospho-CoA kinase [Phycisphaerae bacterium]|nr:dephospho-CoA kinase [Phycisphaerae bacterium]